VKILISEDGGVVSFEVQGDGDPEKGPNTFRVDGFTATQAEEIGESFLAVAALARESLAKKVGQASS
jgi:hypothetical protein